MFAKYGPVLNYHNINTLGETGRRKAIEWIEKHKQGIIEEEKERLGMNTEKQKEIERRELERTGKVEERVKLSPMIMLPEQGVMDLWDHFDEDTRRHVESNVYLVGGREQQHVLTDQEIATMIEQNNREDLLGVLLVNRA